MTPDSFIPTWAKERAVNRLLLCVGALYVHGFVTETERRAIRTRIYKWHRKYVDKGKK